MGNIKDEIKKEADEQQKLSIEELNEEMNKEREQRLKELGYKESIRLQEGENYLNINVAEGVKKIKTIYGEKYVFELIEPKNKILMASQYLARLVSGVIATQKNGEINILKFLDAGKVKYKVYTATDKVK